MKHWMPSKPERPAGYGYLRLSIGGAVALYAAGAMTSIAVSAAMLNRPLFTFGGVLLTGSLLIVALLDAVASCPSGIYVRHGLLFRREMRGGRHG
ncbi:Uncharacterised protein [Starkeya nomas]|uniref:Uncharacterized protein n=1 Tax=Starkeya nomas TaxID=2666134 RepID=A0A5S9NZD1_9HYPH|nr:hypothetical protein [Starkeya nomas]CAA0096083.1 Uncharacterised protein [Starkeya nomas]